jgi:hypothetical protein
MRPRPGRAPHRRSSRARDAVLEAADDRLVERIRRRAASAVVTETLDRVLAAVAATPGDERVLAGIREQAERISRG